MKAAIVVIDMQQDFVFGKLKCERAQRILPSLQQLLESARAKQVPVFFTSDSHLPTDKELEVWGPHGMQGDAGAAVIDEIKPQDGDYQIPKHTYSAFFATELDMILRNLKIDTLILTGLHTNICVRHTAADAFFRGYTLIVPDDGVEAFTEKDHLEGLEYLKMAYKAQVKSVAEIVELF